MMVVGGRKSVKSRVGKARTYNAKKANPKLVSSRLANAGVRKYRKDTGYVDTGNAGAPIAFAFTTTGTVSLVAGGISQGSSVNQRQGKFINWKSMQIRGKVIPSGGAAAGSTTVCTLLIVYDKQPTGVLPAISDILDAINSSAMNKDAASSRFRILKRMDYCVVASDASPYRVHRVDEFLDLRMKKCEFRAAGDGLIGDFAYGAIYAVSVGDHGVGANSADGALVFRTRFVDP